MVNETGDLVALSKHVCLAVELKSKNEGGKL